MPLLIFFFLDVGNIGSSANRVTIKMEKVGLVFHKSFDSYTGGYAKPEVR